MNIKNANIATIGNKSSVKNENMSNKELTE